MNVIYQQEISRKNYRTKGILIENLFLDIVVGYVGVGLVGVGPRPLPETKGIVTTPNQSSARKNRKTFVLNSYCFFFVI